MKNLRVRVYNVRFGDAILISMPDKDQNGKAKTRHVLIDLGNVLSGAGGQDAVFRPVINSILRVLRGRPLDLYVLTHEHMDHVQGLLYSEKKLFPDESLRDKLRVQHAWLTASAEPGYYESHPDAKKKLEEARMIYEATEQFLQAAPEQETPWLHAMMLNNNPRSTADCMDYLRQMAEHTWYIHREADLEGMHPFQEAKFEIWAPEEDTSAYYGRFHSVALGVTPGRSPREHPQLTVPVPPPGVDAGAFYNLVEMRRWGYADNLLSIDRAANNTSVVFCLEWRGWRLLFTGDAEHRSWKEMNKRIQFQPVHFLKVSHHGSHNGTPSHDLLDQVLPSDGARRYSVVSAYPGTYNNVPDEDTLADLESRSRLYSLTHLKDGGYIDFSFKPGGKRVTVRSVGKVAG